MSNKHTPGPWKAHKLSKKIGFAEWEIHYSADGECVAEIVHKGEDARLIAAAPEMYELLEMLADAGQDENKIAEVKSLWYVLSEKIVQ